MGRIQIEKRAGKGNPGRSKGWVPEKAGEEQRGLLRGQALVWLPASAQAAQWDGIKVEETETLSLHPPRLDSPCLLWEAVCCGPGAGAPGQSEGLSSSFLPRSL